MQIKLISQRGFWTWPRFESESFWKLEKTCTVETKQPVSPVFSLSFGITVTIKFAMAATTKPITTTFFRPNLTKKSEKIAIFHCLRLVEIICLLALIYRYMFSPTWIQLDVVLLKD